MSTPPFAYANDNPAHYIDPDGRCVFFGGVDTIGCLLFLEFLREGSGDAMDAIRTTKKLSGNYNGMGDAMRHCIWSCEMARDIGQPLAAFVGWAHEEGGRLREASEKECSMDTHNNMRGREFGARNEKQSCAESCYWATGTGELQTLPH
jgi:hypothetical protein